MTNPEDNPFVKGQLLFFDKAYGITSFGLVKKVRFHLTKKFGLRKLKVGHAGTLDPLATGLMILCTGKKTKEIDQFSGMDKVYSGVFKLGVTTQSYDAEHPEEEAGPLGEYDIASLQKIAQSFSGDSQQFPPIFSAIKKGGRKLYEHARKGEEVEIKSRPITIFSFEITDYQPPLVSFRVHCSKGTYIRSLAHDFGQNLGCGAYLYALRREKIGPYSLEDAVTLEEWIDGNR